MSTAYGSTSTITQATRQQFADAFNASIQQTQSKFAAVTNVDAGWTAQMRTISQRGTVDWLVNNQRFGKRPAVEFAAGYRTGFAQNLEMVPVKFDRNDKKRLDTIALPTGDVIQDAMSGLNRLRDDLFISAATASSYGGDFPHVTATAYDSNQVVPVNYTKPNSALGSNSGLTIWKVIRAKRFFELLNVDMDREELVIAIGPDQIDQLILSAESAANDAWAKTTLDWHSKFEGGQRSAKLFGFNVIVSTRLSTGTFNSATSRVCVAFCKRAFRWKPMGAVETKIEEGSIEDRNQIVVGGYADFGVFREFDELVLKVPCVE